jgi:hypothetical protein
MMSRFWLGVGGGGGGKENDQKAIWMSWCKMGRPKERGPWVTMIFRVLIWHFLQNKADVLSRIQKLW